MFLTGQLQKGTGNRWQVSKYVVKIASDIKVWRVPESVDVLEVESDPQRTLSV